MLAEIYKEGAEFVKTCAANNTKLEILGGASKHFYGESLLGLPGLDMKQHSGIVSYEPGELVMQLRAGTLLSEVLSALDDAGQMLAFEPPQFSDRTTIGGMVASGISGSRRPSGGAIRDAVLGINIIDGHGQSLSFGGQVMKNVAGYDVSRLLVGSMGCLGVITEVSFKVLPKPELETTLCLHLPRAAARRRMLDLLRQTLISASAYHDGHLYLRVSGAATSVQAYVSQLGGDLVANEIWQKIDDLSLFADVKNLWRISCAPASDLFAEQADLIDWGGGQRWLSDPSFDPRSSMKGHDAHATLVRGETSLGNRFQALDPVMAKIHLDLKHQFDPKGILNPNKMYKEF